MYLNQFIQIIDYSERLNIFRKYTPDMLLTRKSNKCQNDE